MNYETEKDYILRLIKEIVRTLISLVLGRKYGQEEPAPEIRYGLSSHDYDDIKNMVDRGEVNEAENLLLDRVDYKDKKSVAKLIFFYEYTSKKTSSFLTQHNYSIEEVLEGLKMLAANLGYQNVIDMLDIY